MSSTVGSESPWQWAKKRRRIFTSPLKDTLSGSVVGAVVGVFRYEAGDPNWLIAVGAAVLTVLSAFLLPQIEALYWLFRRPSILLEEAEGRIAELQAGVTASLPQRPETGPPGPVADLVFICNQTGWARLRVTNQGVGAVFSATVQTYGLTAGAVEGRLVPARWEEVDTPQQRIAPGDTRVLRLATLTNLGAPGVHGWKIHRAVGSDFGGVDAEDVIDVTLVAEPDLAEACRLRIFLRAGGPSEMQRLTGDSGRPVSTASQRLTDLRRILIEAAEYVRNMPSGRGEVEDAVRMAFVVHETVPELLTRAFIVPPTQDYAAYLQAEKQKQGEDWNIRATSAAFLMRLSQRLTEDNLDQGFQMPQTWLQFRESDPARNWAGEHAVGSARPSIVESVFCGSARGSMRVCS